MRPYISILNLKVLSKKCPKTSVVIFYKQFKCTLKHQCFSQKSVKFVYHFNIAISFKGLLAQNTERILYKLIKSCVTKTVCRTSSLQTCILYSSCFLLYNPSLLMSSQTHCACVQILGNIQFWHFVLDTVAISVSTRTLSNAIFLFTDAVNSICLF